MIISRFCDLPVGSIIQFRKDGALFRIEEKSETFISVRSVINENLVIVHRKDLERIITNYAFFP